MHRQVIRDTFHGTAILHLDIDRGDHVSRIAGYLQVVSQVPGGIQQQTERVHAGIDRGVQTRSGACQAGDHRAVDPVDPEAFADTGIDLGTDDNIPEPQFSGIAFLDPWLHGKIRLLIDPDHLDRHRTAGSPERSKKELGACFFHSVGGKHLIQLAPVHIEIARGPLQQHLLQICLRFRAGRYNDNIRTQPVFQRVQAAAKAEHHHGSAENRQCQERRQTDQRQRTPRFAGQIFDR